MVISGCQWSGVPTITISGFSWSNSSRKSLYFLGTSPDSRSTSCAAGAS
jgi:hypothetical protein